MKEQILNGSVLLSMVIIFRNVFGYGISDMKYSDVYKLHYAPQSACYLAQRSDVVYGIIGDKRGAKRRRVGRHPAIII